jgi:hypothetical protein
MASWLGISWEGTVRIIGYMVIGLCFMGLGMLTSIIDLYVLGEALVVVPPTWRLVKFICWFFTGGDSSREIIEKHLY